MDCELIGGKKGVAGETLVHWSQRGAASLNLTGGWVGKNHQKGFTPLARVVRNQGFPGDLFSLIARIKPVGLWGG